MSSPNRKMFYCFWLCGFPPQISVKACVSQGISKLSHGQKHANKKHIIFLKSPCKIASHVAFTVQMVFRGIRGKKDFADTPSLGLGEIWAVPVALQLLISKFIQMCFPWLNSSFGREWLCKESEFSLWEIEHKVHVLLGWLLWYINSVCAPGRSLLHRVWRFSCIGFMLSSFSLMHRERGRRTSPLIPCLNYLPVV